MANKPVIHGRDHKPGGADPIPGLGGIQFDMYPQSGGYLWAESTGFGPVGPFYAGINLLDTGGAGIVLETGAGGIHLLTNDNTGEIHLTSTNDIYLETVGVGGIYLDSDGGMILGADTTIQIGTAPTDEITIGPNLVYMNHLAEVTQLSTSAGWTAGRIVIDISNGTGTLFQVINGLQTLLEIRDDDTLHISSAFVVDL